MAARRGTTGFITRSPPETAGRPPPRPAAGQQPQAAQSAKGARSVEASVRSGRSGYRLPASQCAPGWLGEAGADRGCLKPGMDGVRNALRAPPASAVRPGRSALATRAQAREAKQLAGLQAVLAVLGQRVPASSPGSKPRVLGSCFRRHWRAIDLRRLDSRRDCRAGSVELIRVPGPRRSRFKQRSRPWASPTTQVATARSTGSTPDLAPEMRPKSKPKK